MKKLSKKQRIELILRIIIQIIIAAISIAIDYHFKHETKDYNTLVVTIFSAITTIAGIWITCYLLFFQIYNNRYPMQIIKEKNLPYMIEVFSDVLVSIVFGGIVIAIGKGIIAPILYSIFVVATIIEIFKQVYNANNSLMVNTYVDDYSKDLKKVFNNKNGDISKNTFEKIKLVFDESVIREEYVIAQNITDKTGEIFRDFLSNSISMKEEGKSKEDLKNIFKQITDFDMYQLELCKRINSDLLIKHVANQHYLNIKFCIDNEQYEWYKKYLQSLFKLMYKMQKEKIEQISSQITSIFLRVQSKLIEENKIEWIKILIYEFFQQTLELNFINENVNLKYCSSIITEGLILSLDNKNKEIYKYIFEIFSHFTRIINKIPKGFSDVKVYYALYFNKIKDEYISETEEYIDLLFNSKYSVSKDSDWIEFKFFCITELLDSNPPLDFKNKLEEKHVETIIDVIRMKDDYVGSVVVPDFSGQLLDSISRGENIESICENFKLILNACVIEDNLPDYSVFLLQLNKCFEKTTKEERLQQCKLFDIYLWSIRRTSKLTNKQFLQLTFFHLEDCLNNLDKERKISNGFGKDIIEELVDCARVRGIQNKYLTIYIVGLFSLFLAEDNEYNFVCTSHDMKKILSRGLFNIGTDCIEQNFEDGLRQVSNTLGWFIIYSIKQSTTDLTKYLIDRANELYQISKRMDVSQKTLTFLLTLFTTIGTYCCKDANLYNFRIKIFECLKYDEIESVNTAIKLRTSENDMWNELYKGKTNDLTREFLSKFSNYKNRQLSEHNR